MPPSYSPYLSLVKPAEEGEFQLLATFNNSDGRVPADVFMTAVREFANNFPGAQLVARQDASDVVEAT